MMMAKLLPHLPKPRISEQMDCSGIQLPEAGDDNNLPVQEQPFAVIESIGAFVRSLPEAWLVAYYAHKERNKRNAQLIQLHPACIRSDGCVPLELDADLDGVVAGVLLWASKPLPSPLRAALFHRAITHWWGAYFALHGIVMGDEVVALLRRVANDPRLVAGLWLSDQYHVEPLLPMVMGRNDLWSAIIAISQPLADMWLGRVCSQAERNDLAAVTALVLQPTAPVAIKNKWLKRLQAGHPRLAYLAVRWSRFTWHHDWERLRNSLKPNAISTGFSWFHWFRDIEPNLVDEALRRSDVEVHWQVELIAHTTHHGQYLKNRMRANHPDPMEARLTLEWLQRRPRPRP